MNRALPSIWWGMPFQGCTTSNPSRGERSQKLGGFAGYGASPCRAPPITQDIVLGMAGWCVAHQELTMASLLLLGCHCLPRTGELLQLRPIDFILDKEAGVLSIPSSKSGVRDGAKESVTIRDETTLETMQAMLDLRFELGMSKTPCWDRSGSAFRSLFRRILDELQVSHLDFRPYSLRRGRATSEMQTHGLMEKTLIRGRWKTAMWPSYTYVMGWLCCRAFADL